MSEFVVLEGDCRDHLRELPDETFDAIVTDPPYELVGGTGDQGINNSPWDASGVAFSALVWQECLRVLKPGGHLLAFGATRTYHKLALAIESAGFDIRDTIHWTYNQSVPKSQNIALMLDKYAGVQGDRGKRLGYAGGGGGRQILPPYEAQSDRAKQFADWGTALRPTHELVCVARKECDGGNVHFWRKDGTDYGGVALNIVDHNVGGIRVDASRHDGKWPTNTVLSCECEGEVHDEGCVVKVLDEEAGKGVFPAFKFCRKPNGKERTGHMTQKPIGLMSWLVKLVSAPGAIILDPFNGSGTTGVACVENGYRFVGVEIDPKFVALARARLTAAGGEDVG